jgi:hypothetical protein
MSKAAQGVDNSGSGTGADPDLSELAPPSFYELSKHWLLPTIFSTASFINAPLYFIFEARCPGANRHIVRAGMEPRFIGASADNMRAPKSRRDFGARLQRATGVKLCAGHCFLRISHLR